MAQFIAVLKLFVKMYPMLKELASRAGGLATEIKIDRENKRIELIFDDLAEDISDEDLQDRARRFDDQFR